VLQGRHARVHPCANCRENDRHRQQTARPFVAVVALSAGESARRWPRANRHTARAWGPMANMISIRSRLQS
jgi:hypothetical protein